MPLSSYIGNHESSGNYVLGPLDEDKIYISYYNDSITPT